MEQGLAEGGPGPFGLEVGPEQVREEFAGGPPAGGEGQIGKQGERLARAKQDASRPSGTKTCPAKSYEFQWWADLGGLARSVSHLTAP